MTGFISYLELVEVYSTQYGIDRNNRKKLSQWIEPQTRHHETN